MRHEPWRNAPSVSTHSPSPDSGRGSCLTNHGTQHKKLPLFYVLGITDIFPTSFFTLAAAPYYIIFTRKNQVMLSFLKLRVVVNNREIYPLLDSEPVVIPVEKDCPRIVITDGFHYTKPVELVFKEPSYFNFNVVCAIDDLHLYTAFSFMVILYLLGLFTGILVIKVLSFVPVFWLLSLYYLNRRQFIRIKQADR